MAKQNPRYSRNYKSFRWNCSSGWPEPESSNLPIMRSNAVEPLKRLRWQMERSRLCRGCRGNTQEKLLEMRLSLEMFIVATAVGVFLPLPDEKATILPPLKSLSESPFTSAIIDLSIRSNAMGHLLIVPKKWILLLNLCCAAFVSERNGLMKGVFKNAGSGIHQAISAAAGGGKIRIRQKPQGTIQMGRFDDTYPIMAGEMLPMSHSNDISMLKAAEKWVIRIPVIRLQKLAGPATGGVPAGAPFLFLEVSLCRLCRSHL